MPEVTSAELETFRSDGFVVIRDALDGRQLAAGREISATMLAAQPPGQDHVGPHFLYDGPAGSPGRPVIYYRLHATGHRERWREAVTSTLLEFGDEA